MPATLLAIHGTVTRPGRLHQAIEVALSGVEGDVLVATDTLHLGDHRISFADGRPLSDYDDDTQAVVERVVAADMYLIATPVFRASFTGALKNVLDHVPVEGLQGKACGLIGMGATDHHYLSVDTQLRPVLAWFGAHVVPGMVYLQSRHFRRGAAGRSAGRCRPAIAGPLGCGAASRCSRGRAVRPGAARRPLTPGIAAEVLGIPALPAWGRSFLVAQTVGPVGQPLEFRQFSCLCRLSHPHSLSSYLASLISPIIMQVFTFIVL